MDNEREIKSLKAQRDILFKLVDDINSEQHMGSGFYYYVNKFLNPYDLDYDEEERCWIVEGDEGKQYEYFEEALKRCLELNAREYIK